MRHRNGSRLGDSEVPHQDFKFYPIDLSQRGRPMDHLHGHHLKLVGMQNPGRQYPDLLNQKLQDGAPVNLNF